MDSLKFNLIIDEYLKELDNDPNYLELGKITKEIKTKYFYLLVRFDSAKEELAKANKYYPNYEEIKSNFQKVKTELYSKEEVQEYFKLIHLIEDKVNKDLLEVYQEISIND